MAMADTFLVHPDLAMAFKDFRINRFQAEGADAGGVLDVPSFAIGIAQARGRSGLLRRAFQGVKFKTHG